MLLLESLSTLAHRLGSVRLESVEFTPDIIAAVGRVLEAHTHYLGLERIIKHAPAAWGPLWIDLGWGPLWK